MNPSALSHQQADLPVVPPPLPKGIRWLLNDAKLHKHPLAWATVLYWAVNEMLAVCEHLLEWRARTWPDDPDTHDGGWCEQVCRFIERFANPEQIKIPALYQERFENVSYGMIYNVDELVAFWETLEEGENTLQAMQDWMLARATALTPEGQAAVAAAMTSGMPLEVRHVPPSEDAPPAPSRRRRSSAKTSA